MPKSSKTHFLTKHPYLLLTVAYLIGSITFISTNPISKISFSSPLKGDTNPTIAKVEKKKLESMEYKCACIYAGYYIKESGKIHHTAYCMDLKKKCHYLNVDTLVLEDLGE